MEDGLIFGFLKKKQSLIKLAIGAFTFQMILFLL